MKRDGRITEGDGGIWKETEQDGRDAEGEERAEERGKEKKNSRDRLANSGKKITRVPSEAYVDFTNELVKVEGKNPQVRRRREEEGEEEKRGRRREKKRKEGEGGKRREKREGGRKRQMEGKEGRKKEEGGDRVKKEGGRKGETG
jgi:hypothetical protein